MVRFLLLASARPRPTTIVTALDPLDRYKMECISAALRPARYRACLSCASCAAHSHAGEALCNLGAILSFLALHHRADTPDVIFGRFSTAGHVRSNFWSTLRELLSWRSIRSAEDLAHAGLETQLPNCRHELVQ